MIENLMIDGGYRIDYLNEDAVGRPQAFGFYVRGDLPENEPYSHAAKHRLHAGLDIIQKYLGHENLVAIYVDISSTASPDHPAYQQMKQDMLDGKFHRVFTLVSYDLLGGCPALIDLMNLYLELEGFELIACDEGLSRPTTGDLYQWVQLEKEVCT